MAQEDTLAVAQNGGVSSSDEGEGDGDDLDDDLMDRISSSPSIEDGAYNLDPSPAERVVYGEHRRWPRRVDSLPEYLRASAAVLEGSPSSVGSSAYTQSPKHFPLGSHRLSSDDDYDDDRTIDTSEGYELADGSYVEDHVVLDTEVRLHG